ncbi:MAG: aldehyde dehydrogenase family protein [Planctomycetes bacterium]|nr:aldehyde dehydrogenase family protein [Planctomycetota bacterium]
MAELDRDLIVVQEVRDLLRRAAAAQKLFLQFDQDAVDRVTKAMVDAGARAAAALARIAVEETGYGRVDSKIIKNLFATEILWESIRELKTCGIVRRDDANGLWEVAVPYGIVASIIPTTNPTSTALYKAIISVKARNATVMSPHPRSVRCVRESCRILNDAAVRAGAPDGLVLCISSPTMESTRELMTHSLTDVILATGGSALVKAAYSSGKPAYGVGPGNVPVYIEKTADIPHAVKCIVSSQTFDWGTICASEQAVIVDGSIAKETLAEFRRQGGHFCNEEETRKLERICIKGELMNPEVVGMQPSRLAAKAGFAVPENTTILLAPQAGIGPKFPLSREILTPLLAWYTSKDWHDGCDLCIQILEFGGDGHTLGVHTRSEEVVTAFALEKPANRILINCPTSQGAVGFAANLEPSMTLGCGPMGRNISSDNITARHLVNLKRVAAIRPDYWDLERKYLAGGSGVDFPVPHSQHIQTPTMDACARPARSTAPAPALSNLKNNSFDGARLGGYQGNAAVHAPDDPPAWSFARLTPARSASPPTQTPVPSSTASFITKAPAPPAAATPPKAAISHSDAVTAALLGKLGAPAAPPSNY